jgi:hypothetical protein
MIVVKRGGFESAGYEEEFIHRLHSFRRKETQRILLRLFGTLTALSISPGENSSNGWKSAKSA